MTVIDLTDPEKRREAVEVGYIWSAPEAAIRHALRDIADGLIPEPDYVPPPWDALLSKLRRDKGE
jgi:hypothetical protein